MRSKDRNEENLLQFGSYFGDSLTHQALCNLRYQDTVSASITQPGLDAPFRAKNALDEAMLLKTLVHVHSPGSLNAGDIPTSQNKRFH